MFHVALDSGFRRHLSLLVLHPIKEFFNKVWISSFEEELSLLRSFAIDLTLPQVCFSLCVIVIASASMYDCTHEVEENI